MLRMGSRVAWLAPLMAVILVLGACASSQVGTPSGGASGKSELTVVQGADADSLDQQATGQRISLNIVQLFAETLTKVTWSEAGAPTVSPLLATSWKQLNDTTWQFKLRDGVKFSNGEPFDAAAVKFSLARLQEPKFVSTQKKYVAIFKSVDIVDPLTVNFVTTSPTPLVPISLDHFYIVPPKYSTDAGLEAFAIKPVGTGAYTMVEWVKDDHITLQAKPDYWGTKPKIEKITFKPVPEATTRSAAIQAGQADIVNQILVTDVAALKQRQGIRVDQTASARVMAVDLDQANDPIMKNLKVRQALNYAVDKDAVNKSIYLGGGTVLQGQGLTAAYVGFNPELKAYPYDPDKAKQLLTEAGYPNGFDMVITTPRGVYSGDYEMMQAVAGQLTKVGVRATVRLQEYAVFVKDQTSKKLGPALLSASATFPDADAMFDFYATGGVYSYTSLPEFDALLKQERSTLDPEKRLKVLQQAAQLQHDQALAIWLVALPTIVAVNDRVVGFRADPLEGFDLTKVSLK